MHESVQSNHREYTFLLPSVHTSVESQGRDAKPDVEKNKQVKNTVESPFHFIHGNPILDRKSTFTAYLLPNVISPRLVPQAMHQLLSDRYIARATHNIMAYRIQSQSTPSVFHQDYDDDGETAAGSRLLHMLAAMNAVNVLVVVSRRFGGIKLGPDRFRHINNAARQVIESYQRSLGHTMTKK